MEQIYAAKLSEHFMLDEFLNPIKYPTNVPKWQHIINMTYGCIHILEPARNVVGPITITSGFRNSEVNRIVGGVSNSQHLEGCAADITCKQGSVQKLIDVLKKNPYVDQLLTAKTWLHVSWTPFSKPRHQVIENYYH